MENNKNEINKNIEEQKKAIENIQIKDQPIGKREQLAKRVKSCLNLIDKSVQKVKPLDGDLDMKIVSDYANPLMEEVIEQLDRLPVVMAYYSSIKVSAQLLLDISEYELFMQEVNARKEFKADYEKKLSQYSQDIAKSFEMALTKSQDDRAKALNIVNSMIKTMKPDKPTDKDYDAYIKSKTAPWQKVVINRRNDFNQIKEVCRALEIKFDATRAIRRTLEQQLDIDKNIKS